MDKVIVIGCFVPGMGVVRALANKNLHIIAMTYSENDIAHLSKYVSEVVHVPHPEKDPEHFIDYLLTNAERLEGALLLETADHTAVVLSKHKEILSKYYKIVTPDWEILEKFIEKEMTYALAQECGVPHPKSYPLRSLLDLKECTDVQYPCILKPVRSFEFVNKFQVKNFKVNDETELKDKFQLCLDANIPVILQEIIPGPDGNLYRLDGYINSQGTMVGKFFCRKLRQSPPFFGVMRAGVSTGSVPEIEQWTSQLMKRVNYRGYFSIEFKKDVRDGQLKLMENNCRLVRCNLLATASGVNHPWIIYQDLVKNQQIDITEYKKGVYWIELYTDLSSSIFHHKEDDMRLQDYMRPYLASDKAFADFDLHDLKPFIKLTSEKVRNLWQKVL
jgi:predicted ATP-grasp superfamily ATP-dependent carboligase